MGFKGLGNRNNEDYYVEVDKSPEVLEDNLKKKRERTGNLRKVMTKYGEACDFRVASTTDPKNLATPVIKCLEEGHRVRLSATGSALRTMQKALVIIEKHKPFGKSLTYIPCSEQKEESKGKCTIVYWILSLEESNEQEWFARNNVCNMNDELKVVDLVNCKDLIIDAIRYYADRGWAPISNVSIDSGGNTSYVLMVFRKIGK